MSNIVVDRDLARAVISALHESEADWECLDLILENSPITRTFFRMGYTIERVFPRLYDKLYPIIERRVIDPAFRVVHRIITIAVDSYLEEIA